jgi:hypothetical protein
MRDENGVCPADNEAEHGISARQAADTRRLLGVPVMSPGARGRRKVARLWTTPNGYAV